MRDAYCENLVRTADRDRFLSVLFAPAEHRDALLALYAFNVEITRVREVVRQPLAGEIRLQWWRDALDGQGRGEVAANPVATALLAAIRGYSLPVEHLHTLIESRRFDLYDEPMATLAALERWAGDSASTLIALAARILLADDVAPVAALIRAAGIAHVLTGLLQALPVHAARGQLYVPLDVLAGHGVDRRDVAASPLTPELRAALLELRDRARSHLVAAGDAFATAPPASVPAIVPALLPLAPVAATLARLDRCDRLDPLPLPPWRRQWLIWRAARRPARLFAP